MRIQQDAEMYASRLSDGVKVQHTLVPGRRAYLQVAKGELGLNGTDLKEGDGGMAENEPELKLRGVKKAEILLFDLPCDKPDRVVYAQSFCRSFLPPFSTVYSPSSVTPPLGEAGAAWPLAA